MSQADGCIVLAGYTIGIIAERSVAVRWGVQLAVAYSFTTTPAFSAVTRCVYGVARGVMLDSRDPIMRMAWPSGDGRSLRLTAELSRTPARAQGGRKGRQESGAVQGT